MSCLTHSSSVFLKRAFLQIQFWKYLSRITEILLFSLFALRNFYFCLSNRKLPGLSVVSTVARGVSDVFYCFNILEKKIPPPPKKKKQKLFYQLLKKKIYQKNFSNIFKTVTCNQRPLCCKICTADWPKVDFECWFWICCHCICCSFKHWKNAAFKNSSRTDFKFCLGFANWKALSVQ